MDVVLIILGIICIIVGFIGCIVPGLPGVPIGYASLWLLHATEKVQLTWQLLLIWGIITVAVQVLDYFVPAWGAKKFGGSKAGVWGSTIGIFVGMFFGGWGIILGPFVGAVVGELIAKKPFKEALKAGFGSFIGILVGTILKLICCGFMTYYFFAELFA